MYRAGRLFLVLPALLMAPRWTLAQESQSPVGVQLVEFDDGMSTVVYAFVRGRLSPVRTIEEAGIGFERDPLMVFVCQAGALAVVYRFDSDLFTGDEGMLPVQYRFDGGQASALTGWQPVGDPAREASVQMGLAALGADSNALLEMVTQTALAVRMPADVMEVFLSGAQGATEVRVRVTDPVDGETLNDVFSLAGFSAAIQSVQRACGM